MDWERILDLVMALIERCTNQDGEEAVMATLRKGGPPVRRALRNKLRAKGLRGRELWDKVRELMADLEDATDEDIRELIEDARDV